jgi:hypothetical protein
VPEGWSLVEHRGRRYGLSRTSRADGRSVSVYAEELGGRDVVSANVYRTGDGDLLRPCEMPAATVLAFLEGWRPVPPESPPVQAGEAPCQAASGTPPGTTGPGG